VTYALVAALSPPCPFARFADVGLQKKAWQTEVGFTRETFVLLFGFQKPIVASRVGEHSWREICFRPSWDGPII